LSEEPLPFPRPRPLLDLGKTSKEKSYSYLNLRRLHTWWSVPYSFFKLQLLDGVVGLPRLSPPSSWTWQDVEREVAQHLNLPRLHTWLLVPYLLFELQLQVVVVGLPLLAVNKVAWADLGSIRTPVSA
jgi:hypothetical protein